MKARMTAVEWKRRRLAALRDEIDAAMLEAFAGMRAGASATEKHRGTMAEKRLKKLAAKLEITLTLARGKAFRERHARRDV